MSCIFLYIHICFYTSRNVHPSQNFLYIFWLLSLVCVFKLLQSQLGVVRQLCSFLLERLAEFIWRMGLTVLFCTVKLWLVFFSGLGLWQRWIQRFVLIFFLCIILHRNNLVLTWECKTILDFLRNALTFLFFLRHYFQSI